MGECVGVTLVFYPEEYGLEFQSVCVCVCVSE